jgi:hypothetical protein
MTDDLSQADLSAFSLREMTPAQRAEMRRRLDVFVRAYTGKGKPVEPPKPNVRKWVPGMKA